MISQYETYEAFLPGKEAIKLEFLPDWDVHAYTQNNFEPHYYLLSPLC